MGISTKRAGIRSIGGTTIVRPATTGVFRFALCQPIKAGIGCNAHGGFTVGEASALKKNPGLDSAGAPHLRRALRVTNRTSRGGTLEQLVFENQFHFSSSMATTIPHYRKTADKDNADIHHQHANGVKNAKNNKCPGGFGINFGQRKAGKYSSQNW